MANPRIGLLGGTFDPVHLGHLILARHVLERMQLERVVFVPAARPPHKPGCPQASFEQRLAMVRLAIEGDGNFACDDCEIHRAGPSYTVDTVTDYRRRLGDQAELFWIIGADALADLDSWYRLPELVGLCELVTLARAGYEPGELEHLGKLLSPEQIQRLRRHVLPSPTLQISSSDIRARAGRGLSIRYLVPPPVEQYIIREKLYPNVA